MNQQPRTLIWPLRVIWLATMLAAFITGRDIWVIAWLASTLTMVAVAGARKARRPPRVDDVGAVGKK